MRQGDVLRREEFMNPDVICLEEGASGGSLWMNAGPQAHVGFFFLHVSEERERDECEFVILKPVLGHTFSVCKFTQRIPKVLNHFPAPLPFRSL